MRTSRGEGRERGSENPKQSSSCQHRAQLRARTHQLWDRDLSKTKSSSINWLSYPGALLIYRFCFYFYFLRERVCEQRSGRQGDTESEAGSGFWAVSTEPDAELQLIDREIVTWAEVRCLTYWAIQVPLIGFNLVLYLQLYLLLTRLIVLYSFLLCEFCW